MPCSELTKSLLQLPSLHKTIRYVYNFIIEIIIIIIRIIRIICYCAETAYKIIKKHIKL